MTFSTPKILNTRGVLLLVVTTLIWGTTFPIVKDTVTNLSPAVLVAVRFMLAALAFSPWLPRLNRLLLRDGILLGSVYFVSCITLTIGLETTSAHRAAFIVGLNAVLVPLLVSLLGQRLPIKAFLAAGLALTGIWVMSWESGGLSIGDFWAFVCALGYTVYIPVLGVAAPRHPPLALTTIQLWVLAGLSLIWAAPELIGQAGAIAQNFNALLYLALVGTAFTVWTQAVAQQWVPPHEAALLYTLEPVFAAVFSFWLLGEQFGIRGLMGSGLVLAAMALSQKRWSVVE